jgi:hypothetical protein
VNAWAGRKEVYFGGALVDGEVFREGDRRDVLGNALRLRERKAFEEHEECLVVDESDLQRKTVRGGRGCAKPYWSTRWMGCVTLCRWTGGTAATSQS